MYINYTLNPFEFFMWLFLYNLTPIVKFMAPPFAYNRVSSCILSANFYSVLQLMIFYHNMLCCLPVVNMHSG